MASRCSNLWQKAMNTKTLFSHNTDHWATPSKMYSYYMLELGCIDPCPLHCEEDNTNKIYENQLIYINPPYSKIHEWVKFIKNNYKKNLIYLLIPARTDTKYFHELLELNPKIEFIKGRLKFNDKGCAPFPSILMTFDKNRIKTYNTYNKI